MASLSSQVRMSYYILIHLRFCRVCILSGSTTTREIGALVLSRARPQCDLCAAAGAKNSKADGTCAAPAVINGAALQLQGVPATFVGGTTAVAFRATAQGALSRSVKTSVRNSS